jgi:hypothetical protein
MRIYVEDINPKKITYNKLISLQEFYLSKKDVLEIFSEKGMYLVENSKIWRLFPTNEKIVKFVDANNNLTFLIDESNIEKIPSSQLPIEHECVETTIFIYHMKNVRLIIEGFYKKTIAISSNVDKYYNFVVTNFYFEPKNENFKIDNPFLKNEINVFLSMLN